MPPMDFTLRGVTSMSVDTHKFGMAHKGTSVVLYRDASLRAHQFTAVTDWSGGLYISPGFAGSKSGALIATAWAAMLYHGSKVDFPRVFFLVFNEHQRSAQTGCHGSQPGGKDQALLLLIISSSSAKYQVFCFASQGYEAVARELMETREVFVRGLKAVPELEIMGDPCMSLVAFRSRDNKVDIYQLLDLLSKRGWHLNALHRPPALHMCFTARSANSAEPLLNDIREAVRWGWALTDS